jgi:hypothetical protein
MINDLWYKNAIIYCLSVDAYMDANGDGIGDFPGLMRRLARTGTAATQNWLSPVLSRARASAFGIIATTPERRTAARAAARKSLYHQRVANRTMRNCLG